MDFIKINKKTLLVNLWQIIVFYKKNGAYNIKSIFIKTTVFTKT